MQGRTALDDIPRTQVVYIQCAIIRPPYLPPGRLCIAYTLYCVGTVTTSMRKISMCKNFMLRSLLCSALDPRF